MSKDKKPCSSCSKSLDLLPSGGSVKDVISNFIKNSQIIKPNIEHLFNSENIVYKMTSYLKTKLIKGKGVELVILQVISKYDVNTKKFELFNSFKSSQTTNKNEAEIMRNFFKNPTKYIDLKTVMVTIGELINSGNTGKSKALKSSNCCNSSDAKNDCNGVSQQQVTTYPQADYSTNYKCKCQLTGKTYCYSSNGCRDTNNCNPNPAPPQGVEYTGTTY